MNFFEIFAQQSNSPTRRIEPVEKGLSDKNHAQLTRQSGATLYNDIRKGDFVKIIRLQNSVYNIYTGYIGEIKDYKRNQDTALVFLHAINNPTPIRMSINHFIRLP